MLKKEMIILYYGFLDQRTPFYSKIPALLSIIYLLSPVDLIPDFIPFIGYLDDLLIVPLLLNLSIRLLPAQVREECISKAIKNVRKFQVAFAVLILIIIGLLVGMFFLVHKWLTGIS